MSGVVGNLSPKQAGALEQVSLGELDILYNVLL